jgi:hypothetical protein
VNRRSKLCLAFAAAALAGAVALLIVPLHAKTANVVMANNTIRGGNACGSLYAHPPPTYQMLASSIRGPGQSPAWPNDPCSARRSTGWWEVGALVVLALVLAAAAAVPAEHGADEDLAEV